MGSDRFFDRDHDSDYDFNIGIRFENENRGSILRSKSRIDFHMKIAIRLKKLHLISFLTNEKTVIPQIVTPRISRRTRIQTPGTPPMAQMRTVARS